MTTGDAPLRAEPLAERSLARHGLAEAPRRAVPERWLVRGIDDVAATAGSDRFVLKRDSLARDWIARATRRWPDPARGMVRGARSACSRRRIRAPYLGVGVDGDTSAS